MSATQTFRELTYTMRPQDPRGDGSGLRFETGEHGGDYPDNMPQAITVTDAQGRWAVYVPLRVGGQIVVPESEAAEVMTYVSPDESKQRRFTQFRHAVNEALAPHEGATR